MIPRPPRNLRADEKDLWERVRQSAVPLHESAKVAVSKAVKSVDRPKMSEAINPFVIGERSKNLPTTSPPSTAKTAVLMDSKYYGRLKKGKLSPEARIDLHGMTLAEAHPALIGFILQSHRESKRLVLVITGKGKATDKEGFFASQTGILRQQVPHWLKDYPLGPLVLQVTQAHGKHGGGGAIYVYLRRRR